MSTAPIANFEGAKTPLPPGITLIEASAGTGKTYSLCRAVVRLIEEEGLELTDILLVTFTEAATAELRERLRRFLRERLETVPPGTLEAERLRAALRLFDEARIHTIHAFCARLLERHALGSATPFDRTLCEDDSTVWQVATEDFWRAEVVPLPAETGGVLVHGGDRKEYVALSLERFAKKLEGPLRRQSRRLPRAGEEEEARRHWKSAVEAVPVAMERLSAVLPREREAMAAWLEAGHLKQNKKAYKKSDTVRLLLDPLEETLQSGRWSEESRRALHLLSASELERGLGKNGAQPPPELPQTAEALHRAARALQEALYTLGERAIPARRRELCARASEMTYDDLLLDVHAALQGPRGDDLARAVRAQTRAVLVDEFQDTDAVQAAIFQTLFGGGETRLALIGDPKQSIYRFRGADLDTYLALQEVATLRYTLRRNYRSSPGVVTAVNVLFAREPSPFGRPGVVLPPQTAANEHYRREIPGASKTPAFTLHHRTDKPESGDPETATVAAVARLLSSGARVHGPDGETPLGPEHCAVLTRTNTQALAVVEALRSAGIPAGARTAENLWQGTAMRELLRLLHAVHLWTDPGRRQAALTGKLCGLPLAEAARLHRGEADGTAHVERFAHYARRWREDGVWAALTDAEADYGTARRLLRDGEAAFWQRLEECAEALHELERATGCGPGGLLRRAEQFRRSGQPQRESRALAAEGMVEVLTAHKSKGLDFGLVFLPYAAAPPRKEDEEGDESDEEAMRLLYVACTRARYGVHLFTFDDPAQGKASAPRSALYRLLDPEAWTPLGESLQALATEHPALFALEAWPAPLTETVSLASNEGPPTGHARVLPRPVPQEGFLTSFTALTEGRHSEEPDRDERPPLPVAEEPAADPLEDFPPGVATGRAFHDALEQWDYTRPESARTLVRWALRRHGLGGGAREEAAAAVLGRVSTCAPFADVPALGEMPRTASVRELDFTLPCRAVETALLADLFEAHGGEAFPADWPKALRALERHTADGFLRGSIDWTGLHEGHVLLADWKTNRLPAYDGAHLARAMTASAYYLQGVLYCLALRRHLAARGYPTTGSPQVAYLFLRGLREEDPRAGVLVFTPPEALLEALEDALLPAPASSHTR